MAEVFGAVASGIGIAGVAAQAIDGIRKLQTFCNDVRDAPEEIIYMSNELEILLSTIAGIEVQIQRNAALCQNLDPTPALRFVYQSVISLNAVIQKLTSEIAQKRTLGSIKTAWKKKVLEAHLAKIERSKTSLGLAVSAYSTELFLQTIVRTDTRIGQLSTNVAMLTTSCRAQLVPVPIPQTSDNQQSGRPQQLLVDGDDDTWRRVRKRPKSSGSTPVLSFSLILPYWLTQYTLQISVRQAAQSWMLNIKPHRVVPYPSKMSNAILYRDFDGLRELINSEQATVFDRDEYGRTVLHEVATQASVEDADTYLRMARFLIERGADINELNHKGFPAMCHLNMRNFDYAYATSNDMWNLEIFRLLVDDIDLNPEVFWKNYGSRVDSMFSPVFERILQRILPLHDVVYPRSTVAERLNYITDMGLDLLSPRDLALYLDFESLEAAYPTLEPQLKDAILRVVLTQWGYQSASALDSRHEEWGQILGAIFAAEADEHELCSQGITSILDKSRAGQPAEREIIRWIGDFVRPYARTMAVFRQPGSNSRDCRIEARDVLKGSRYLISQTNHYGIELVANQSRKRLEICFDKEFMESSKDDPEWKPHIDPHTLSLYYDDDTSTWTAWNAMYEDYCGEFWDLLDHPERMIPGTWID